MPSKTGRASSSKPCKRAPKWPEKLLANTRQLLSSRVEDARVADRRSVEATHGRDTAEKRVNDLEVRNKMLATQVQELEQSHAKLSERVSSLSATLKTRDAQLGGAEEKLRSASERISRFDTDTKIARMSAERRIDELTTTIVDERMERQVLEGALKAARQECSLLQRELSPMRLLRRSPPPPEPIVQPEPAPGDGDIRPQRQRGVARHTLQSCPRTSSGCPPDDGDACRHGTGGLAASCHLKSFDCR